MTGGSFLTVPSPRTTPRFACHRYSPYVYV
jgi:hypothetical protein